MSLFKYIYLFIYGAVQFEYWIDTHTYKLGYGILKSFSQKTYGRAVLKM